MTSVFKSNKEAPNDCGIFQKLFEIIEFWKLKNIYKVEIV